MAKASDGRPAREVIDEAIREGEKWERMCFALIFATGAITVAALITGLIWAASGVSLAGGLGGSVSLSSLIMYVNGVRRDKARVRLLELALAKAATADEVIKVLREVFDRPGLLGRIKL